jgi:hypothetical protein
VGLTDILFGRKRLKGAKLDKLFALSTAQVTLETELGLHPSGAAAVDHDPRVAVMRAATMREKATITVEPCATPSSRQARWCCAALATSPRRIDVSARLPWALAT